MSQFVEEPTPSRLGEFLAYCSDFGKLHDDSFVPSAGFEPTAERPSFALRDDELRIVGAASLLLTRSQVAGGRGRFAILHAGGAGRGGREGYRALLGAALSAARGVVPVLYLFLPADLEIPTSYLLEAGFVSERIAYLMGRDSLHATGPGLPESYALEEVLRGDRVRLEEFVAVRNRNFAEVLGSLPSSIEDWEEFYDESEALHGGTLLLRAPDGKACGTIHLERDEEPEAFFIGAISVDANRRGQGLGRGLVREALGRGRRAGFSKAYLSVNALNEKALGLYLEEGFTVRKAMNCLAVRIEDLERSLRP